MSHRFMGSLIIVALLISSPSDKLQAQFEADARWAPPNTNVLVMVNSLRMLESPLAKKERAEEKARAAFATGTTIVTPDVDR